MPGAFGGSMAGGPLSRLSYPPLPPPPRKSSFSSPSNFISAESPPCPPNNEATVEVNKEELRRAGDLVCSFYISFMGTFFPFFCISYRFSVCCFLVRCAALRVAHTPSLLFYIKAIQ